MRQVIIVWLFSGFPAAAVQPVRGNEPAARMPAGTLLYLQWPGIDAPVRDPAPPAGDLR